jgi:urease accessory protein UreE
MKLSDILKAVCQEYHVDCCYIADQMGIPDEVVDDWMDDKSVPTMEQLEKFSEMFAIPMKVLKEAL